MAKASEIACRARLGARHPFGLGLLVVSGGLAGLIGVTPELAQWSGREPRVLASGVAAYLASVLVVAMWPPAKTTGPVEVGPEPRRPDPAPPGLETVVRRALQALNEPGALARSSLLDLLPASIAAVVEDDGGHTPLLRAQALRTLLVEAVERLNVPGEGGKQALQYLILHEQYVRGHTVVYVANQLARSEQNVFLHGKEGRQAVADDLWRREQRLACDESGHHA